MRCPPVPAHQRARATKAVAEAVTVAAKKSNAVVALISVGLALGACATSQDHRSNVGMHPQQVAVANPPKAEIEADGRAVQAPPRVRKHSEPDDPSEPFSPNYGPVPDGMPPPRIPVSEQHQANAAPVILRSRTTPMTPAEAHAIISAAMVAHEIRNP